jgi:endogenous inhibitor of DNA gyrase (YacG/DUF329 family)
MSSPCPNCRKPGVAEFHPFCSKRCREVDLNRWFTGAYAVPAAELDDPEQEALDAALDANPEDDNQQ